MHIFIRYFVQVIHNCVLKRFHVSFLDVFIDELGVVVTLLLIGVAVPLMVKSFAGLVADWFLWFSTLFFPQTSNQTHLLPAVYHWLCSRSCFQCLLLGSKIQTVVCENYDGLTKIYSMRLTT